MAFNGVFIWRMAIIGLSVLIVGLIRKLNIIHQLKENLKRSITSMPVQYLFFLQLTLPVQYKEKIIPWYEKSIIERMIPTYGISLESEDGSAFPDEIMKIFLDYKMIKKLRSYDSAITTNKDNKKLSTIPLVFKEIIQVDNYLRKRLVRQAINDLGYKKESMTKDQYSIISRHLNGFCTSEDVEKVMALL